MGLVWGATTSAFSLAITVPVTHLKTSVVLLLARQKLQQKTLGHVELYGLGSASGTNRYQGTNKGNF